MRLGLGACVAACLATWAAAAPPVAVPVELAILGGQRAARLRLDFVMDGRPLATAWDETLTRWFADLDYDGNGTLDRAEAARAPSALRVRQLAWAAYLMAVPVAALWDELDTTPTDGKVTREEFATYYRRRSTGVPHVGVGSAPPAALLTDALLKHLDRDADGRVSQAEWQAADTILRILDQDDDELIRPGELVARTPYPGTFGGLLLTPPSAGKTAPKMLDGFPIVRLPDDPADTFWAQGLGERGAALAKAHSRPADDMLTIRIGTRAEQTTAIDRNGQPDPADAAFIELDNVRLLLYTVPGRLPDAFEAVRVLARERFTEADRNGDGFVDRGELDQSNYTPLREHWAFADRGGDGRVSRAAWGTYLDLRAHLAACQVVVTLWDHGAGLFELLDADGDGALSVRELRGAWARLGAAGCINRGELDRNRLPRQLRAAVSMGSPNKMVRMPLRRGPVWFRAMDRNGDGDVSRREFVGTDEAFRKLDTDGDGLISADEASRSASNP